MKLTKILRAAMAALLTLVLCAQGLPAAAASTGGNYDTVKVLDCTLTVEFAPDNEPIANCTFRIWKVGTLTDGRLPYQETGEYNILNEEGDWLTKAGTLLGILQQAGTAPFATAATGEDGKVTFSIPAQEQGVYLVAGDSQVRGDTRYTPAPFLVLVPFSEDLRTWETEVETHCKPTSAPVTETVDRHVLKSWNDNGHRNERPATVVVDLLRDGEVYDTVTLTADGNWRYDWTELDGGHQWSVAEHINTNYSVLVTQEGITFHITNTYRDPDNPPPPGNTPPPDPGTEIDEPDVPLSDVDEPEPEPEPDVELDDPDVPLSGLPQTGQLWWPVAPMVIAGIALTLLGWKRRRDWRASDET